ncbi:hypothetical protein HDU98_003473, partial [Podochytrium sp. JEL0797]
MQPEATQLGFIAADQPVGTKSATFSAETGLTLSWIGVGYSVKEKSLLHDMNGSVEPGQVLAVMGPSGAGKSIFLDLLAGRKRQGTINGKILLNGTERPIKKYSSYVTKDDSLNGSFTVRETLRWAVELNLANASWKSREEKVNELLAQFGLTKCADNRVGDLFQRGISGGEKRRLSIAVQLVKEPPVIFIDEPTSGLDSAASLKVMQAIQALAQRKNCAIVCTIHQPSPSTYDLFDKVLFLARGNTVFFGEIGGSELEYFESIGLEIPTYSSISDTVLDYTNFDFLADEKVAEANVNELILKWTQSGHSKHLAQKADSSQDTLAVETQLGTIVGGGDYTHPFGKQVGILLRRNLSNLAKNFLSFWIRFIFNVGLAILIGTTWLNMGQGQSTVQERFSGIFFAIGFLTYLSAIGVPAFLEERAVFYRERMNRTYSVGAYVVAHTIVSVCTTFISTLAFAAVAYPLMGLNSGASKFFTYFAFLFLTCLCGEGACLCIAAAFPIFLAALALFSMVNGTEMVTAGFLVRAQNIPNFWRYGFHYWNFQKWTFEAMSANEFAGQTFECAPIVNGTGCNCLFASSLGPNACTFSGEDVLASYGYDNVSYWKCAVIAGALAVVFRFGFYIILRMKKPSL